jgi:hypothetical protein
MMIDLPQSLLLGTACVTPVILPCLGTSSKRCVESRKTHAAAVLLRARFAVVVVKTGKRACAIGLLVGKRGAKERNIFVHCDFFTVL